MVGLRGCLGSELLGDDQPWFLPEAIQPCESLERGIATSASVACVMRMKGRCEVNGLIQERMRSRKRKA